VAADGSIEHANRIELANGGSYRDAFSWHAASGTSVVSPFHPDRGRLITVWSHDGASALVTRKPLADEAITTTSAI
jgi:hypothetical protein